MQSQQAGAIAVSRFGLGGRPGEIQAAQADAVKFLGAQLDRDGAEQPGDNLAASQARLLSYRIRAQRRQYEREIARLKPGPKPRQQTSESVYEYYASFTLDELEARTRLATQTLSALRERWTLFWCNHFALGMEYLETVPLVGAYEREAIRPYVFGNYADMLSATVRHPATLAHYTQNRSYGPDSPTGRGRVGYRPGAPLLGLQTLLASKTLELHTLGGGYSEQDVRELAMAMTGWSVGTLKYDSLGWPDDPVEVQGRYFFRPAARQPGVRTVLGKTYEDTGAEQAIAIVHELALQPSTARLIATKVAKHFVADAPPPSLVSKLETAYRNSGGDLGKLAQTLINAEEAWSAPATKIRSHHEFVVAALRAFDMNPYDGEQLWTLWHEMGQRPWATPSPSGWSEEAWAWSAPDALMRRYDWAQSFAQLAEKTDADPIQAATVALGSRLEAKTTAAMKQAGNRADAITLLLMSPEFQRR